MLGVPSIKHLASGNCMLRWGMKLPFITVFRDTVNSMIFIMGTMLQIVPKKFRYLPICAFSLIIRDFSGFLIVDNADAIESVF